jgi:two-component system KDP operon response regulator KdpE
MAHRVLIVEDDPTLRLVMDNLRSEGYEIDEAFNGACAIRRTQTATPDIVVLDLTLPDWDVGSPADPAAALAGQSTVRKTERARPGADNHITKPFDMEELLAHSCRPSARTAERQPHKPGSRDNRLWEQARLTWKTRYSLLRIASLNS